MSAQPQFSKELVKEGNGVDKPKKGDEVTMQYTGWLYDVNASQKRGKQYIPPSSHAIKVYTDVAVIDSTAQSVEAISRLPSALAA